MAEKKVISDFEAQIRQLIADHRRLTAVCKETAAERDVLRKENRDLQMQVGCCKTVVALWKGLLVLYKNTAILRFGKKKRVKTIFQACRALINPVLAKKQAKAFRAKDYFCMP